MTDLRNIHCRPFFLVLFAIITMETLRGCWRAYTQFLMTNESPLSFLLPITCLFCRMINIFLHQYIILYFSLLWEVHTHIKKAYQWQQCYMFCFVYYSTILWSTAKLQGQKIHSVNKLITNHFVLCFLQYHDTYVYRKFYYN